MLWEKIALAYNYNSTKVSSSKYIIVDNENSFNSSFLNNYFSEMICNSPIEKDLFTVLYSAEKMSFFGKIKSKRLPLFKDKSVFKKDSLDSERKIKRWQDLTLSIAKYLDEKVNIDAIFENTEYEENK